MTDRTSFYSAGSNRTGFGEATEFAWPSDPVRAGRQSGRPGSRGRSVAADAAAQALYAVFGLPLALAFFTATWVLVSVGAGLALLWVGVPVLVFGLLVARFGAFLQLGLYESAADRTLVAGPPPPRPRGRGRMGTMAMVIADPGSWRAFVYWSLKMVLAPVQFGLAVGLYAYGLGALSYPYWRQFLPAQQASDGSWHRGSSFGTEFFVDTWPRMAVQAAVGVAVLMVAPAIVRAVNSIDRALLTSLVVGNRGR